MSTRDFLKKACICVPTYCDAAGRQVEHYTTTLQGRSDLLNWVDMFFALDDWRPSVKHIGVDCWTTLSQQSIALPTFAFRTFGVPEAQKGTGRNARRLGQRRRNGAAMSVTVFTFWTFGVPVTR